MDAYDTLGVQRGASLQEVGALTQHEDKGACSPSLPALLARPGRRRSPVPWPLQIKEAYKDLAKRFHPDLCPAADRAASEAAFKEITAAYTRLTSREHAGGSHNSLRHPGAGNGQQGHRRSSPPPLRTVALLRWYRPSAARGRCRAAGALPQHPGLPCASPPLSLLPLLHARSRHLAADGEAWHRAQAEWYAQYAETVATGHTGQPFARAGVRAAKAAGGGKFSNGLIASVLALPLLLSVFHLT